MAVQVAVSTCSDTVLQRADRGCASGHNAPSFGSHRIDPLRAFCGDLVVLAMQPDLRCVCDLHRPKCSEPDVQGDRTDFDAGFPDPRKDLRREVQACGRRRRRAPLSRVDRLISIAIECPVAAANVRR